ncbi:MAG: flagellar M-ring protein FliF [Gammaproteobacteria bacterium]|nr:flagellar M-ring protein FliF [Gammaproteobacteria bacterium]MDX5374749.1 flagellar M-ring protein FliF [Gammaproteobacteria bacterium]
MAIVDANNLPAQLQGQLQGLNRLSAVRQVGLIVGLAATIALGVAIVLWSQEPNYGLLYANLSDRDKAAVMDGLTQANIPYKLDAASGAITVPATQVHDARLRLATMGLPQGSETGYELLDKSQGFGTSRMAELSRHQRALEGELARSIMALSAVDSARVHLAIPKQTVFVRERSKPSASVVVHLYPGRVMDESQIAGIVHLVASSVPELEAERVTVVDQKGQLLTTRLASSDMIMSDQHFKYTQRLQNAYAERVLGILEPIVGEGAVKAQVAVDVDFTTVESTSETYDPVETAVRSEQISEQETVGAETGGVPGALANQPPPAGVVGEAPEPGAGAPRSASNRVVRNYEIDRTISHSRGVPGTVRRLSVAVVVDNKPGPDGELVPYTEEELQRLTALVNQTVGLDAARGDTINIVNAPFVRGGEELAPLEPTPFWKEPWLWDLARQGAGVLGVLFLLLFVLRPVLRALAERGREPQRVAVTDEQGQLPPGMGGQEGGSAQKALAQLRAGGDYEDQLSAARSLAQEDPKRVAQVMKTWVAEGES